MIRAVLFVVAVLLAAAPPSAAAPIRIGETFLTTGLDPTKGSNGWALVSHGVAETLFSVDKDGKLVPQLAADIMRLDATTWRLRLKPDRRFSDGAPVDATNVAASLTATLAANLTARATGGLLTFAIEDPLTLRVMTEKVVPVAAALFAEWPLAIYHRTGDGDFAFSGPYAVADFQPDRSLTLVPSSVWPDTATRDPVTIRKFADAQSLALAYEGGDLDIAFGLPSEVVPRLRRDPALAVKSFPVAYQYMGWLNTRRPALSDMRVRQAIDLALDRPQLASAIGGGLPATGAYAAFFAFAMPSARPTDAARASALLDEAGWTRGADGLRRRDGIVLRLGVIAYPQRPDLVAMLPILRAQLTAQGIAVDTRVVDNISAVAGAGDFDLALWAQHTAPSGDPAFFLASTLRSNAPLNYAGYADPAFDAILDDLSRTFDPEKRIDLAQTAQRRLFATAPVTFLLTPQWHVGLSRRLADYDPWGSDYHIVRDDLRSRP